MKELFTEATVAVERFCTEDVICTSATGGFECGSGANNNEVEEDVL